MDRSGVSSDDPNIVLQAASSERTCHRHDRRISGSSFDVLRIADLAAIADIIENDAAAVRLHARIDQTDHVGVTEALERPACAPLFRGDVEDGAAWDHTG